MTYNMKTNKTYTHTHTLNCGVNKHIHLHLESFGSCQPVMLRKGTHKAGIRLAGWLVDWLA